MMYRIVIDPSTAMWDVQVSGYFMFWRTLRRTDGADKGNQFASFDDAMDFVEKTGLEKVYDYSGPSPGAQPAVARG